MQLSNQHTHVSKVRIKVAAMAEQCRADKLGYLSSIPDITDDLDFRLNIRFELPRGRRA
jgi:hypothetical protein